MSAPWVWAELGVERTSDVGVIRRAYAARLKLTNPEDDGEAFQRLRAAYDHALAWARRAARRPAPSPEAEVEAEPPEVVQAPEPVAEAPAPEKPAAPAVPVHVARLWSLQAVLRPDTPPQAMTAAFHDVVDGQEMDDIGVALEVERALAELVASRVPLSDPLVKPLIARFGWSETAQLRPGDEAKAYVLRRAAELEVQERMARLRGLLSGGLATGDEISQAMADLFNSRAMDDLGVHARVEGWVAQLILDHAPATDFLIEPAARRFGWRRHVANSDVVDAVLQRYDLLTRPRVRRASWSQWFVNLTSRPVTFLRLAIVGFVILSGLFRTLSSHDDGPSAPPPMAVPTPVTAPAPSGPVWSTGSALIDCRLARDGGFGSCKVASETAKLPGFGQAALLEAKRVRLKSPPPSELAHLKVRLKVSYDPDRQSMPVVTVIPPSREALRRALRQTVVSRPVVTPPGGADPVTPPTRPATAGVAPPPEDLTKLLPVGPAATSAASGPG